MQVYWFLCRRNIANADWRVNTVKGHAAILDLVRKEDEPNAETEVQAHISAAYARIITSLTPVEDDGSQDAVRRNAETLLLT